MAIIADSVPGALSQKRGVREWSASRAGDRDSSPLLSLRIVEAGIQAPFIPRAFPLLVRRSHLLSGDLEARVYGSTGGVSRLFPS